MNFKRTSQIDINKIPEETLDTKLSEIITLSHRVRIVENFINSANITTVRDLLLYQKNIGLISGIGPNIIKHIGKKLSEHLGFEVIFTPK